MLFIIEKRGLLAPFSAQRGSFRPSRAFFIPQKQVSATKRVDWPSCMWDNSLMPLFLPAKFLKESS